MYINIINICQPMNKQINLPCFGTPDPGEICIRWRIRRYRRAEIEEAIEVDGAPEGGGPRRFRLMGPPRGGSTVTIERGKADAIQINGAAVGAVRRRCREEMQRL